MTTCLIGVAGGTTFGLAADHFGIGFYAWVASLFLLQGCIGLAQKSDGIVKK